MAGRTTPKKAKVFDLDKLAAENRPTEPFRFKSSGKILEIHEPPDMVCLALAASGQYGTAMEMLLGDETWAKIQAEKIRIPVQLFEELLVQCAEHFGASLGE